MITLGVIRGIFSGVSAKLSRIEWNGRCQFWVDFGVWPSSILRERSCACKSSATSMYTTAWQFLWDLIDEVVITSSRSERKRARSRKRERERDREKEERAEERKEGKRGEIDSAEFYFIGE